MQLEQDVELAPRTTLGVGGPAAHFVLAEDEASLLEALAWAERHRVSVFVLGGGSNVVVSDAGVDGLVIQIGTRGRVWREHADGVELTAAAGEPWDPLVAFAVQHGWGGIECLSGIPGLVGATPVQNVGAYGQDVSETIVRVRAWDTKRAGLATLSPAQCGFSYRDSVFKSGEPGRWVVLDVTYRLRPGAAPALRYPELERQLEASGIERPTLADVRAAVLAVRRSKSMVLDPADENRRSCGSFFLNPIVSARELDEVRRRAADPTLPTYPQADGRVKLAAAWLIEHAGLARGERAGAVGLSTRHTLALVCHEGARASDVVAFARRVRSRVEQRFGVRLVPEPRFWGFASLDDGLPDERLA